MCEVWKEFYRRLWAPSGHSSCDRVLWPGHAMELKQKPKQLDWQSTPAFSDSKGSVGGLGQIRKILRRQDPAYQILYSILYYQHDAK